MNKLILLALLSLTFNAEASDWKLAGYADSEATKDQFLYYDTESIIKNNGTVKFWVKAIERKELDKALNSKKLKKTYIDETGQKIAAYYAPPIYSTKRYQKYLSDQKVYFDSVLENTLYETVVNRSDPQIKTKFFWELDCKSNQIRALQINLSDAKGKISILKAQSDWTNISPDTNSESWHELFCNN